MAFNLEPIVIFVTAALAVALLVLIILTLTYIKSRKRLINSQRDVRVRRKRHVKFSQVVSKTTTSAVGEENGAAIDDFQPGAEYHQSLYRPIHAIGVENGTRTQRQIYLPPVRRGVWAHDMNQPQFPDAGAFSWPQPPIQEAVNINRTPAFPLQQTLSQQQQQQQSRQRFRDVIDDIETSDAFRRRRDVYRDVIDSPYGPDSRNNIQPVVPLPRNNVPSFQTPFVVLDNPSRPSPNFRLDNQMDMGMPTVVASSVVPVSSAPIPAVHQPVAGSVQLPSSSATTAAAPATATANNVLAGVAEVSWSVVEGAEGANGWSSSTAGYMTGNAGAGTPSSSSAAFFSRPVPAIRQSMLATSPAGNFGGAGIGNDRRQFEDQEQSVSLSSSGTIRW